MFLFVWMFVCFALLWMLIFKIKSGKFFATLDVNDMENKDMSMMTEFIFSKTWSPQFKLATRFPERTEDTYNIYRVLRYPYQLPKSVVQSFNPHNAGQVIGALSWLVELAETYEQYQLGTTSALTA